LGREFGKANLSICIHTEPGRSGYRSFQPAPGALRALAIVLLLAPPAFADDTPFVPTPAESPKEEHGDVRLEVETYGDIRYSHFDYGPDQKSGDFGSPPDSRATVDIPNLSLELEYRMREDLALEAEVEFEHGGTGAAMELEYEEFGEYEVEIEKGGEISIEALHVTKSFGEGLSLRAGHFVTAIGMVNWSHRPTNFFTAARPEEETSILPVTWDETGVEAFGGIADLRYRVQVVNALDSSGFSSKYWIVGGHQGRFEDVKATDLAVVGRLDWQPWAGIEVGGSGYYGNTTNNRPKPDMEGIPGHLAIGDAHATLERGPWRGRALFAYGTLENADQISAKNSRLSSNLEVPRTPVASAAYAWYAELGFNVVSLFQSDASWKLYPYAHYGQYDTMAEVDPGIFADPRFLRTVAIAGLNVFPSDEVVVKVEYSHRELGNDQLNDENTVSIDLGFSTALLSR
jgi:hypothetical protein